MAITNSNETWIREADAIVKVEGIVSEKNLEFKKTDDGVDTVEGDITVKTSDVNFVRFVIKANKKTRANGDNPVYTAMQTVDKEYKSIAADGEENASKVSFSGKMNPYVNRMGREGMSYKASFINRYTGDDANFDPRAEFEVEVFIESIVPEMRGDEETGRVLVRGQVPAYGNGINPITLVADEDIADAVEDTFTPGQTVKFYGEVVNSRTVVTKEVPMAIGKPKIDKQISYKNELVITGASSPYEDDEMAGTPAPYDRAVIERAKREAEMNRESARNNSAPQSKSRPSGAARGRSLGSWS